MKQYKVQPLDLMQSINAKYHEPFIRELIEFDGEPDADRLVAAIGGLIEAFPLLKCRYDRANNAFVENGRLTAESLLKRDDAAGRQTLLTESPDTDETLIRLILSKNLLSVVVSHLVCDGSGFKTLLYLLCDFYNGKTGGDFSFLMNREFSQVTENLKPTAGTTAKMLFSMLGGYKNKRIYEKTDREQEFLAERRIDAETMSRARGKAKRLGATLNDVFLTAYARAIGKSYRRRKINLPCTVDLRKYAKGNVGIANLTGTYTLNVKIGADESFSESLSAVSRKMRKQKGAKNDIAGPMLLVSEYEKTTLEKFLKLYGGMNTSAFTDYTNLGTFDADRLFFDGTPIRSAVFYGGLSKAPCFQIAVSSFRGETVLSAAFVCGEDERKKADSLISAVTEEIRSFSV